MKRLLHLASLALVALLIGCASAGVPAPQTFNQNVAAGIASVTAVRQSATVLLKADKISVSDAQNVQQQADTAMAGIVIARQLGAVDPAAGQTKLTAAITVLTALNAYLAAKGTP